MKNIVNSIRVAYENWLDEERFDTILSLMQKYPCSTGQVALFTQSFHSPLTIGEFKRRADIMKLRLKAVKAAGLSGGINILCTIGHHNENLGRCFHCEANRMTNIEGQTCEGSFCMRDKWYREQYIKPCYTAAAEAKPDFIWVDDDVRYGHIPVGNGCFCDLCIAAFNERYGFSYTREALRQAFNRGDTALRLKWLEHSGEALYDTLKFIGDTVRAVSPEITLGFMTGERFFESYNFRAFSEALSDGGKYKIMWRPGGGAYTDYSMESFTDKMREIARQNVNLPDYVEVIQSEIENFPYQLIKKSPLYTAAEAQLYMLGGCTGAAFNIFPSESGEPVENIERHLIAIDRRSNSYAMLSEKLRGMKPYGIATSWKPTAQAYTGGDWTRSYPVEALSYAKELFSFGLPECFAENGCCSLLNGFTASMLTDDEAIRLLSGGLYMDADAVNVLSNRGFSEYIGFEVGEAINVDAIEQYTDDELNDGIAGGKRNCRQAFNGGMSASLLPKCEKCRVLCRVIDYAGEELAGCSLGIYENSLGGRVAAASYYPFSWISDAYKTSQLTRLLRYISDYSLPSYIDGYFRVKSSTFIGGGRICAALFNLNPDTLENVPLAVLTDKSGAVLFDGANGAEICASKSDKGYKTFVIPEIKPFDAVLLELK